ncbi:hypothetical protein N7516_010694 [Penicillium verrucosum]|uniref:uncharacterized protein n=1 Tax=Penicillium verrucosum TaxID=60171 RepID=UPI002544FDEA|nr:uncharacterized protein N7516_010694 [Penicillium verrucosum]KAJ5922991.1 hypothetical protein N7516_010694 [Penicillium verrucosum]
MTDTARSRQTRQAPTLIKQWDENGASAKSHLPRLPSERIGWKTLGDMKIVSPVGMHNSAPKDVSSGCKPGVT